MGPKENAVEQFFPTGQSIQALLSPQTTCGNAESCTREGRGDDLKQYVIFASIISIPLTPVALPFIPPLLACTDSNWLGPNSIMHFTIYLARTIKKVVLAPRIPTASALGCRWQTKAHAWETDLHPKLQRWPIPRRKEAQPIASTQSRRYHPLVPSALYKQTIPVPHLLRSAGKMASCLSKKYCGKWRLSRTSSSADTPSAKGGVVSKPASLMAML